MNLRQRWARTTLPNKLLVITGAIVAFSSVVQMVILGFSLHATNAALEASIESSHNDQRAWVAVQSIAITTLEKGKPLRTEMKVINTGKTIALDVKHQGILASTPYQLDVETLLKETPQREHGATVLFSGIDETIPAETKNPLTEEEVAAIKDRHLLVYSFTVIQYKDIFKKAHTTQFCGIFVPALNRFEDCVQHNKVD